MFCLAFIRIHVGYEFEIDKSKLKEYGWDYVVAATAAFPWLFCAAYFVFVLAPPETWRSWDLWTDSLLTARFAAPTSAGVLFSMLAAAGLATSWVFKKARVLAIFDDLDTVLLMIPLKMLIVGLKWQLAVLVPIMAVQLWLAWKYLVEVLIPAFVLGCLMSRPRGQDPHLDASRQGHQEGPESPEE
jgi:Kef-type K+ transport system membrane component KefB